MSRPYRLLLLLLPAALGLALAVFPGHAQQDESSRYAFADTTLLRDTLGLRFDQLFPLADSLGLTPDTLRALSVRYAWSLERLVWLSDSLRMPVDSVGVFLERERLNPLTAQPAEAATFRYGSSYNVQQTSSVWSNSAEFKVTLGSLFLQNTTNIQMDRYRAGTRTSLRQTRAAVTEAGWRFSPNFSLGARANLERFNSLDPGSVNNQGETKNEFQLSMRTRQQPSPILRSDLNFFSGVLDVSNFQQVKRGISGDLNGTVRLQGRYVTHDLSGQVNGNVARTRVPTDPNSVGTKDFSNNLRGTLGLFPGKPVGMNLSYNIRRIRVETRTDTGSTQAVLTRNSGVDGTLRLRLDNERYLNLTGRLGAQNQSTGGTLNSQSSRRDMTMSVDGRYPLRGWSIEGRFSLGRTRSEFPTRSLTGGYGESLRVASIDVSATRNFTRRLVLKASGSVGLSAYRYFLIGLYPNPPVNRDQYRQNYRLNLQYTMSDRFSSGLALDVSRNVLVNIPAKSTASNNELRTYRAEWRWNYRIMRGLTASQSNSIGADYTHYTFLPQNDRLTLDYSTATTLNAVLSDRFTVDVLHNARHQPSGTYTEFPDGLHYLSRSDVNDNYTLSVRMSYRPTRTLSVFMQPDYLAGQREGSQGGALVPTRTSRQLNFSGGASLNLGIGEKGRLTGDIRRTYRADRSITYTSGEVAQPQPRTESDYWNASLQLSWQL